MLNKEAFSQAQEALRSGIYIVTSTFRRQQAGCTCVWVSRASFMPPLMGVTLAPTRQTFDIVQSSGKFCINVLGEGQLDLARKFGFNTGSEIDKFAGLTVRKAKTGSPVIEGSIAYLDCSVTNIVETGDHQMVLGEVVDAALLNQDRPAVYVPESFYAGTPKSMVMGAAEQ